MSSSAGGQFREALFLSAPKLMVSRIPRLTLHCRRYHQYQTKTQANSPVKHTASNTRERSETRCRESIKRKVALVVGYDGANYHGLQRNKDVIAVSDVLEKALHEAGAISDHNVGHLEKIKWQAAARTDRGVCAAGNVISAKILFNKDEHIAGNAFEMTEARVNNLLPEHVRLFGIRNITGSFSARLNCNARSYEYLLPGSALPPGVSLEEFDQVLKAFQGTHAFHNYTIGQNHLIPPRHQSLRYMTEVTCDKELVQLDGKSISDIAWVRIRVKGQSFMLHQIRKMVSMAVLTLHGRVPHDAIGRSFSRTLLIDIPPAPALGLFLDGCRFDGYNKRHQSSLPKPLSLDDFEGAIEEFKKQYILPSIARRSLEGDALEVFFKTADAHPPRFQ